VGPAAFEQRWPGLADAVQRSVERGPTSSGADSWLGGGSSVDTAALTREYPPRTAGDPPRSSDADQKSAQDRLRKVAPYAVPALVAGALLLLLAAALQSVRRRRTRSGKVKR
jgi:hypothetical protein